MRERTGEQNALRLESGERYVYKNSLPYFTLSFADFNIPNVLLIIKSNANYQTNKISKYIYIEGPGPH